MERTSRATRGISEIVTATITFTTELPSIAMKAMASRIDGIAISPSMIRMMMLSSSRENPATSPIAIPAAVASTATPKPTTSDTRAP